MEAMEANLQKRVTELERQSSNRGIATSASVPSGKEAWRRLEKGMTMPDVRGLFGEPRSVTAGAALSFWYYAGLSDVMFDRSNRVVGWTEP